MLYDEIKTYKTQFNQVWKQEVFPFFSQYEIERKSRFKKMLFRISLCSIVSVIACVFCFQVTDSLIREVIAYSILLPSLIALIVIPSFMSFSFVTDIKAICMQKLLKSIGNLSWKTPDSIISEETLKISELFPETLESTEDDYISGSYNNTRFKISELLLSGEGGATVFKGIVIAIKSNKKIKNKTIIADKSDRNINKNSKPYILQAVFSTILFILSIICFKASFESPSLAFLGFWCLLFAIFLIKEAVDKNKSNSKIIRYEKLQSIKLEDTVFQKKYIAYSSDQVEARYLITTSFMERFRNLQTVFGTQKLKCSFFDDTILFAISTRKNLFEIGNLWTPLTNPKMIKNLFEELIAVYLMIDYFKLDEHTKI